MKEKKMVLALLITILLFIPLAAGERLVQVSSEKLNLRSGPGLDQPVLALLARGRAFRLLTEDGEWLRVSGLVEGDIKEGYLHRDYVNILETSFREALVSAQTAARLRLAPNLEAPVIASLPGGALVQAATSGDDFRLVYYRDEKSGWTGYVFHRLLDLTTMESITEPHPVEEATEIETAVEAEAETAAETGAAVTAEETALPIEEDKKKKEAVTIKPVQQASPTALSPATGPACWEFRVFHGLFISRAESFRELYGNSQFLPRLEITRNLGRSFSIRIGASRVRTSGASPLTDRKVDASQIMIALGAGWRLNLGRRFETALGLAPVVYFFSEKLSSYEKKGQALGFDLAADLAWRLAGNTKALLRAGYNSARHEQDSRETRLGGFHLSLGLSAGF